MNHPATILVIEDNDGTRRLLTMLLEDEGYQVISYQTAEEALNYIASRPPLEVVISDLRLPDGSGLQVLWALRKISPDSAFMLITGYASIETAVEAINEGAFTYHVKPLDIEALKVSVRNAVRQRQLTIETRNLVESLQQANNELERASLAETHNLSIVSHELKNPLAGIMGYSQIMLSQRETAGPLNEQQQTYLRTIWDSSFRLKAVIDDLQDISIIESDSLELAPAELDVRKEIEEVVHSIQTQIDPKQMRVSLEIPHGLRKVKTDRHRFSQIIGELLTNACKFSSAGATITVTATQSQASTQIDISDTGMGVSSENHSRLFSKFFRGDSSSTREVSGTGLGLYIIKHLIEAQGGEIWFSSEEGKGSKFSFTLPWADRNDVRVAPLVQTSYFQSCLADTLSRSCTSKNNRAMDCDSSVPKEAELD